MAIDKCLEEAWAYGFEESCAHPSGGGDNEVAVINMEDRASACIKAFIQWIAYDIDSNEKQVGNFPFLFVIFSVFVPFLIYIDFLLTDRNRNPLLKYLTCDSHACLSEQVIPSDVYVLMPLH